MFVYIVIGNMEVSPYSEKDSVWFKSMDKFWMFDIGVVIYAQKFKCLHVHVFDHLFGLRILLLTEKDSGMVKNYIGECNIDKWLLNNYNLCGRCLLVRVDQKFAHGFFLGTLLGLE